MTSSLPRELVAGGPGEPDILAPADRRAAVLEMAACTDPSREVALRFHEAFSVPMVALGGEIDESYQAALDTLCERGLVIKWTVGSGAIYLRLS